VSVKLHLKHKLTEKLIRLSVCLFIRCVCQGRRSYVGHEAQMLCRNLTERWRKNPGSNNKYAEFYYQLIIRKIIEIIATRYPI